MTSPPPASATPLSPDRRQQLEEVRRGLLRVHKALLEDARIRYEREQGRIEGSGALLQLVLNDPWFAWLHPLSGLVVQIDELLASDEATLADGEALLNQARGLIRPDANGDERSHAFHLGHEGAATLRRYAEPASVAAVLVGFRRGAELANPPMLAELIE